MGSRTQGLGMPGRGAELRVSGGYIQWRQEGAAWANLVALADITPPAPTAQPGAAGKSAYEVAVAAGYSGTAAQWLASLVGAAGKSAELRTTATAIQWRQTGGAWADLVTLAALTGPAGFTLVGTVSIAQSAQLLAIQAGIKDLTVALAGTVVGERYQAHVRKYKLNGAAAYTNGRPANYAVIDAACNVAGQITISHTTPAIALLGGQYELVCDMLKANAT